MGVEGIPQETPDGGSSGREGYDLPEAQKGPPAETYRRPVEGASALSRARAAPTGDSASAALSALPSQLQRVLQLAGRQAQPANGSTTSHHRFWSTMPVRRDATEPVLPDGPIDPRSPDELKEAMREPYPLVKGFYWCTVDIEDDAQLTELYELLNQNYVEDDSAMFRFDYSRDFLRWALRPPGWIRELMVGVRTEAGDKLVAFISAVVLRMRVRDTRQLPTGEVNFLCVHKRLRHKRLAPVLIREIRRRGCLHSLYQAVYTSGARLPGALVSCLYWHRPLQVKKLIECQFTALRPRMTMKSTMRLYALPEQPQCRALQPLRREHCGSACALLRRYLEANTCFHPEFEVDDFMHWFLPRPGVVYSYVLLQPGGESAAAPPPPPPQVTDLISFYSLPSTVLGHSKHQKIKAAYSFYNVPGQTTFEELMKDALVLAKNEGFDVFNALHLMQNRSVFDKLLFSRGDGALNYFVFDWRTDALSCEQNGLVLL
ncbi:hypothetical protein CDCA_CDCA11G3208 [Cyanidium caldarium]|uniref:Glycylpeptide N-tetradecanoyltransferase n=1 Tax=Cyanidium caldarium TaxID=2771 RepID=A0AAV9IZG1_CYACA|nr:hypothetical protein CDCA_CDCA11G3208 [Cyanidium caldarium]